MKPLNRRYLSLSSVSLLASVAAAQSTERVSVATGGAQVFGLSAGPSTSFDGNEIAFDSAAGTLVPGDTNSVYDVFVRDRAANTTVRVSVTSAGTQANGASVQPSLSSDGARVAFQSDATNLAASDTNSATDVFVRDLGASTTIRCSVDSNGVQAAGHCVHPAISPDGRYVAFATSAANLDLVHADTNGLRDIYLHDTLLGTTVRVSARDLGAGSIAQANGASDYPVVSQDGGHVAFESSATNLTMFVDSNVSDDVFTWDRSNSLIRRVSPVGGSQQADGAGARPSISADGRWIAFESLATNLGDPGTDFNLDWDVYRWDRTTGTFAFGSCDYGQYFGVLAGASTQASISDDGRYVAFTSDADGLVRDSNTNANVDVYRHDFQARVTSRVSIAVPLGEANADCATAQPRALSRDGHVIAFHGLASNLVLGDTNNSLDVFAHDSADLSSGSIVQYCNDGIASAAGCTPVMSATGEPSISDKCDFILTGSNIEGRKNGMLFYGISGPMTAAWGTLNNSFLCVKAPTQKIGVQNSMGTAGACDGTLSVDWFDFAAWKPTALGSPLSMSPGTTVCVQAWFKEVSAKTTTLSSALEFTVQP